MGTLIFPRNARDFRFKVYRFGFYTGIVTHPPPPFPFISHGVIDRCIHSLFTSLPEHGFYIPNIWHWHIILCFNHSSVMVVILSITDNAFYNTLVMITNFMEEFFFKSIKTIREMIHYSSPPLFFLMHALYVCV